MAIEKPKDAVEEATMELVDRLDLMVEDMGTVEQLALYRALRDACNERLDTVIDELMSYDGGSDEAGE